MTFPQKERKLESPPKAREVTALVDAVQTMEGAGFPVRRPFPTEHMPYFDPFLLLDHLGPIVWKPGEAVGAPDHPHRGFETISYVLEGYKEHKDSGGHKGRLGPGDVQWMTAGSGVVHSEMPEASFRDRGGLYHGFQIWVNLPARDKMMAPRYQEVPAGNIPQAHDDEGRVHVRVIAGEALGVSAVIDTRIPVSFLHYTITPGGKTIQAIPSTENVLVYVISGEVRLGINGALAEEGQMAIFGPGEEVPIAVDAGAKEPSDFLLLAGRPLGEPVARWGPFVMNTQEEITQAVQDYQAGRMGKIDF